MSSTTLLVVRGFSFSPSLQQKTGRRLWSSLWRRRNYCARSDLSPPDVSRLAEAARISLTPKEVEDFAPKIRQVVDWFGQLQSVDLHSVEPALRADTESDTIRPDVPDTFENREAMLAAVPSYDDPYIKVPKILNKE